MVEAYEKAVGHPPRTLYPDDPDWKYTGSREEKRQPKERIGLGEPAVIEGQEELPL